MPTTFLSIGSIPARRLLAAALLAVLCLVAQPTRAGNYIWDGQFNGQWDFAVLLPSPQFYTNWNVEPTLIYPYLPTAADTVTFTGTTPNNTINLNGSRDVSTATFTGGGSFSLVNGELMPSGNAVVQSGASLRVYASGRLYTGVELVLNTGTLNVEYGGRVSSTFGTIGRLAGSTGWATVSDSLWNTTGGMTVGYYGTGTLDVVDSGYVSNQSGFIGASPSGIGTLTVTGGSWWDSTLSLIVGADGTGTLNVSGRGTVKNQTGFIGGNASSTGRATVAGGQSTWTNSGDLSVGHSGTGTLNVQDSGAVTNTNGYIGRYAGSIGTATVTGATWNNRGDLFVGDAGTGSLTIENSGTVNVGDAAGGYSGWIVVNDYDNTDGNGVGGHLYVKNGGTLTHAGKAVLGYLSGYYGYTTITGTGSTWTNDGEFYLGEYGNGSLSIEDGARVVSNTTVHFGYNSESSGTATVSGSGSTWTNTGDLYVGSSGTGSLTIENGGQVSNTTGYLGSFTGTAAATVTGTGSTWTNTGDLYLGRYNDVTLDLGPGGLVTADQMIVSNYGDIGFQLDGTTPGMIAVAGLLTADGNLNITLTNGFAPAAGDNFNLLDFGSITGSFDAVNLPTLESGLVWDDSDLYAAGSLSVFALGDMNGDGALTNGDIAPFVQALTDPAGYAAAFPNINPDFKGDINLDGSLTNGDIAGFVAALTGGSAVPEPTSLALMGLGGLVAFRRRCASELNPPGTGFGKRDQYI